MILRLHDSFVGDFKVPIDINRVAGDISKADIQWLAGHYIDSNKR